MVMQSQTMQRTITMADKRMDGNFNPCVINRGSYMSARVLLNLVNKLGKSENVNILASFRNFIMDVITFRY